MPRGIRGSKALLTALGGGMLVMGIMTGGGASPPGAAAGVGRAGSEVLRLRVLNDQFAAPEHGAPGPDVGDQFVFSDWLHDGDRRVGQDGGTCQVSHVDGGKVMTFCTVVLQLEGGQIVSQALWERGTSPLRMAVTGGTGDYRGVRGELEARDIQTPNETYTITLQR